MVKLNSENTNTLSRLPRDTYKLRCKSEPKFAVSKKGNPYLKFEFEIVEPVEKTIDGVLVPLAGTDMECICVLPPNNAFMLENLHKGADLPLEFEVNEDSGLPEGISYTGIEVWALCQSKEEIQTNDAGESIINPKSGKPLTTMRREIKSFCTGE